MNTTVGIRFTLVYRTIDQDLARQAAQQLGLKLAAEVLPSARDTLPELHKFRYEGLDTGTEVHVVDAFETVDWQTEEAEVQP